MYDFLESVSDKYGIDFWKPGAGIIHQVVLENYAFPGGMVIGTDSHTVNAGGLGMIAIGVGGADAVDVMARDAMGIKISKIHWSKINWKIKWMDLCKRCHPKISWNSEYKRRNRVYCGIFGPGAENISCTGKGTICNMGAEIGATTSIFGYDENMANYLKLTGRGKLQCWQMIINII